VIGLTYIVLVGEFLLTAIFLAAVVGCLAMLYTYVLRFR